MTDKKHILVVEDDASLSEWISDYLTDHGFEVSIANRGDSALELIEADMPDLVLLDIMLPEKDGFQICKEARAYYANPILIMTACSEETDEVAGLDLGADDYINKPVKPRVLLARINALLRRESQLTQKHVCVYDNLRVDSNTRSVSLNNEDIMMSSNEFDVLWLLASQADQVVSRTELIKQLRGIEYNGFDRSIDIRISRIRKKLLDDPQAPKKIKTIWGKGYLFASDAWR